MLAFQNFLLVVVLPIVSMTGLMYLFRWWMKRSTGYDPLGDKGQIPPKEMTSNNESYASHLPPKWSDEASKKKP